MHSCRCKNTNGSRRIEDDTWHYARKTDNVMRTEQYTVRPHYWSIEHPDVVINRKVYQPLSTSLFHTPGTSLPYVGAVCQPWCPFHL